MRPVAPRAGFPEITFAEDQEDYKPLTGAVVDFADGTRGILTRWRLDESERARIASGEDLYVTLLTFGRPMPPIDMAVGLPSWALEGDTK